ncbi:MAG: hypothetical protein ACM3NR_03390 [Methanosarcina sp.]
MSCLRSTFLFCIIFLTAVLKAQVDDCVGVITSINGNIQVRKAQSEILTKAYWGFQLFPGDQVITWEASRVIITRPDNTVMKLGPGSSVILTSLIKYKDDAFSHNKKISSASLINLEVLAVKKDKSKESGALAGFRSLAAEKYITAESPYNTMVRTARPAFSWNSGKSFNTYKIRLYDSNGLLWEKKVTGTSMNFPADEKDLTPGMPYSWNIEAEGLYENEKSDILKFSIVSVEQSKEIDIQENEIRNSLAGEDEITSLHSVLGTFYMNHGLIHEAINEFKIIAEMYPVSFVAHEILSFLYNETGNRAKATEEHRIALSINNQDDR